MIKKIAQLNKPVIISTGMATIGELETVVQIMKDYNNYQNLILLKCTSNYPASNDNSNLLTIPHMKSLFNCQVGLSDHTLGNGNAAAAVTLGATVIEKHFTLDRSDGGVDSKFSMEPDQLKLLVNETEGAWRSLGTVKYGPTKDEIKSKGFRRSIYIVKDLKKGDIISKENIRIIRPGLGLKPEYYAKIIGKKIRKDVKFGSPMEWSYIMD